MIELNPFDALRRIAGGYCVARCLHVIADLGVADFLDETPQTAASLASSVGAHPDALMRILRLLSAYGVFEFQEDKFLHSPASRLLRTDHPHSMRSFVRMFGLPINWQAYGEFGYSARTGLPAVERVNPNGFWGYLVEHPEANAIFNQAMTAKSHAQVAGITAAYDFSGSKLIGDIGGGRGHLLCSILDRVPMAKGVLFDQPHVIEEVSSLASERLALQAGDFFTDDLPVCDTYVLMEVIHGWGDDESVAILNTIRRAAPTGAKLLVIETILPDDPGPDWSKMLDIHMLTLPGGKQRTLTEYKALFGKSGCSFEREIDTGAGISILETAV